ncbi:MAG: hypothetical protein HY562_03535, partial [Ignavibacteriales bacterium]|nr:hypothetical protein [Ignavibacteriales bacterium]
MIVSKVFFCLLVGVVAASSQEKSMASGTLTVNGTASTLSFVRTLEAQDWDMGPNHKFVQITVTKLFLSDVPVGDVEDDFDLSARGKEGTLHGLRLKFNKKGEVLSAEVYDKAFKGGINKMFPNGIHFERKVFNDKVISGKIGPGEPDDFASVKYDYTATF